MSCLSDAQGNLLRPRFAHIASILILALLAFPAASLANDGTWILDANGNWSTVTNWSSNPSIPNGQDQTATFGPTTALRTVTADAPFTVGNLIFNSGVGYT